MPHGPARSPAPLAASSGGEQECDERCEPGQQRASSSSETSRDEGSARRRQADLVMKSQKRRRVPRLGSRACCRPRATRRRGKLPAGGWRIASARSDRPASRAGHLTPAPYPASRRTRPGRGDAGASLGSDERRCSVSGLDADLRCRMPVGRPPHHVDRRAARRSRTGVTSARSRSRRTMMARMAARASDGRSTWRYPKPGGAPSRVDDTSVTQES